MHKQICEGGYGYNPPVHDGLTLERLIKQVDWVIDRESAEEENLKGYPDPAYERDGR